MRYPTTLRAQGFAAAIASTTAAVDAAAATTAAPPSHVDAAGGSGGAAKDVEVDAESRVEVDELLKLKVMDTCCISSRIEAVMRTRRTHVRIAFP